MGKHKKFNKKQAVKFELIPGKDENGNPTVMFKPVQTRSKLSQHQRNKIIQQISDYQIEIDGKMVNESQIPSFVLAQIKGRADLVFNQKNPDQWFDSQAHEDYDEQQLQIQQDWDSQDEQGQLIPQQQYMGYGQENIMIENKPQNNKKQEKEQEEIKEVEVDGKMYRLTKKQLELLDIVLPENYDEYKIDGVDFVKYDDDGIRIDEKDKIRKYIADVGARPVLDSYDFVPDKIVDIVDNDLEGEELRGDLKEVDEALNFQGEEEEDGYEELEDDFFAKLVEQPKEEKKVKKSIGQGFKKKQGQVVTTRATQKKSQAKKPVVDNEVQNEDEYDEDDEDYEDYDDQITDEMLDKALEEYDRKGSIDSISSATSSEMRRIQGTGIPYQMKGQGMELIKYIEERQGCTGKDGELDWRTLTKKQKRQYMKNKKIRSIIEEVRERQIAEKLKDKKNVKAEDLHLKQYVSHIPYQKDHVMQESIKRDQQTVVDLQAQDSEDYETDSEEDDIISYRAKTSVISSNLATVEEVRQKKNKKTKQEKQEEKEPIKNVEKVKVVLEKRNKNQTPEERKQRKEKLKELKKLKKEQKKEFTQIFQGERKKVMKKQNCIYGNPLHKVSYVKIV